MMLTLNILMLMQQFYIYLNKKKWFKTWFLIWITIELNLLMDKVPFMILFLITKWIYWSIKWTNLMIIWDSVMWWKMDSTNSNTPLMLIKSILKEKPIEKIWSKSLFYIIWSCFTLFALIFLKLCTRNISLIIL